MVFPNGGSILGFCALARHAWPDDLRQTINIHRINAHALLNGQAHIVGPRLSAKNSYAQTALNGVQALAFKFISQRQHITWRDHDDVGCKVLQQLHLSFGLSTTKGNHR